MSFSIFEAGMILAFGAAWPFSIWKSYTSRSNKGKSISFVCIVGFGYLFGIIHKVVWAYDKVIILYIINFIMIVTDIILYIRNRQYA